MFQTMMSNGRSAPAQPLRETVEADETMNDRQAAEMLGMRRETLQRWRCQGKGPKFIQISARCIRYRKSDLSAWLNSKTKQSTSEY